MITRVVVGNDLFLRNCMDLHVAVEETRGSVFNHLEFYLASKAFATPQANYIHTKKHP